MSLKSNIESGESAIGMADCSMDSSGNCESELTMVCDLDLDFDDCYLLGLPKLTGNVFEEMKMLEELDLDLEDLFLFGGLPKFKDANDDDPRSKDSGDKEGKEKKR
ncbi:unnamed protein product [Cylindrotheca closterium]|uniref:Uncharacterized protein n=1 Tax=Cylindrotheca closterium TaxID=2856 RepID=A0AAD2FT41_9STRA|nr:unnamed protein product [Cylindrotheca closterium]